MLIAQREEAQEDDGQDVSLVVRRLDGSTQRNGRLPEFLDQRNRGVAIVGPCLGALVDAFERKFRLVLRLGGTPSRSTVLAAS